MGEESAGRTKPSHDWIGHAMAFAAIVGWSGVFATVRYMRLELNLSPGAIYFLRFDILALVVLVFWVIRRPQLGGLNKRQWLAAVAMGFLIVPVYQWLFIVGSKGVGAGLIGTLVATSPVHVSWMAALILRERFGLRQTGALAIALSGAVVPIFYRGGFEAEAITFVAMIAAMPIISAVHTVFMRSAGRKANSSWDIVSVMYIVAVVCSQPLMSRDIWNEWMAMPTEGWVRGVYLATLGQLVPMTLWVMALRRLPAMTVALYQFVLMSLAGMWGWLLMSEPVIAIDLIGMALVTTGLVLNARRTPIGRSRAAILE